MAITKAQKKEQSEKLENSLHGMQSLVFVNFKTLSVKNTIALRRKLRGESVKYTVIKKTLLKRVLGGLKDRRHNAGTNR
jgi:ribosomal protein L10